MSKLFFLSVLTPSLKLNLTVEAGWVILRQKAVVAEQFAALFVILLVNKSRVALVAAETLIVPVSFPIKHQVLHMDWQLTLIAILRYRLCLGIFAPEKIIGKT